MPSRVLETVLTGRNLLSPVLTGAAADVEAFDAKVVAAQERAALSAETSARAQTTAAERVQAANARTAASSSEAAAKVSAANVRSAESSTSASSKVVAANARAAESSRAFGEITESSAARAHAAWATLATKGLPLVAAAMVVITGKMAGDYQQLVTKLETTAGESQKNLGMVGQGMLNMAGDVGVGAQELAKGMYTVDSANIHGADSLIVLKAAAQGAKQENADLTHVVDAVTTSLHDFHLPASQAATVTSELIAAVSHGKTTFDDLTAAMHSVEPRAAAVGMSIGQTAGALAAMTSSGMHAEQAAQNLGHSISSLSNMTKPMRDELYALGLNAQDLQDHLGQRGVAGTLQLVSDAIVHQLGPAGKLALDALSKNKTAVADLSIMMQAMPAPLAKLSQGLLDGTTSVSAYSKAAKGLGGEQAAMALQFLSLYKNSDGFNAILKAGGPAVQTYIGALAKATGTSDGLNVALQLTGENATGANSAIAAVSKASADAHGNVAGWDEVQGNLNQKLAQASGEAGKLAIEAGQHLLPVLTGIVGWVGSTGLPAIGHLGSGIGTLVHDFEQLPAPVKEAAIALGIVKVLGASDMFAGLIASGRVMAVGIANDMRNVVASARSGAGQVTASFVEAKAAVQASQAQFLASGSGWGKATGNIAGLGAAAGTAARGGLSALKSGIGGVVGLLGGPWGVATIAATVGIGWLTTAIANHNKQIQADTENVTKWQKAISFGDGTQISDAVKHLDDLKNKIADNQKAIDAYNTAAAGGNARGGIGTLISRQQELTGELDKGTKAWQAQLAGMTPVEEGNARVATATEAVTKALHSGNPDQVAEAYGALAKANTFLAGETNKDAEAQKSANQQLQDAATLAIGARDAALGYKLSQLDLKGAIADVAARQADGTLKGDALTKAQLQLAQQVENTATAAGAAAEAQAKASGVTATGTLKNDAMLASLRESAKHLTGPALDAINGYIKDLEATTTSTAHTRDAVANLGITVDNLPPGHLITIEAPTDKQMKDLHDLAYLTLTLPDGHVVVSANTNPARDEINNMIADYRSQVINLRANYPALNAGTSQRMGTYADGGWTGPGAKYTPAGIVHANEFVVPSERVNALGGPGHVGALVGMPGYANGGYVPAGNMQVGTLNPTVHMNTGPVAAQFAAMIAGMKASAAAATFTGGGGGAGSPAIRELGRQIAAQSGYASQFSAIDYIFSHESGWNPRAQNPTSTAYGIPQFLNATWAHYGGKTSDAGMQIRDGIAYMRDRYGSPNAAAAFWAAHHWYKDGTNFVPSDQLAVLHRGEAVVPAAANQGAPFQAGLGFTPTGAPGYAAATGGRTALSVAAPQVTVQARVFIGDREITDIARVEATTVVDGRLEQWYRQKAYQ